MTDEALLAGFLAGTLEPAAFHHDQHVRVAWLLLRERPAHQALALLSAGLRRLAAGAGKPERYHETITAAYLFLVGERVARQGGALDFESFARRNPDLLCWQPNILERYYSSETLGSELARRVFVLPERERLEGR
jgi:hypothetical protein